MSLLDALPHVCTAKLRTRTKDSLGGGKDSYAVVFTGRACWRQPAGDAEVRDFQQRGQRLTHKIYFSSDPGLDERHVLMIGSDTMRVLSVSDPDASVGLGILWRCMVELMEPGVA